LKNISFTSFNWNGRDAALSGRDNNIISGCWFGLDSGAPTPHRTRYQEFSSPAARVATSWRHRQKHAATCFRPIRNTASLSPTRTRRATSFPANLHRHGCGWSTWSLYFGGVFLANGQPQPHRRHECRAGNVISGNLGNGIPLRGSTVVSKTMQRKFHRHRCHRDDALPTPSPG